MDSRADEPAVLTSHPATVGAISVRRALPQRRQRTVGAWCFADHLGPARVTAQRGLDIGPHPHIGLQTVTWLTAGEALHRDGLGTEQTIRPGQLNLMTAGRGLAHAEEATGSYEGRLEGIQLWVALPEATRHGPASFQHHADLPRFEGSALDVTVLVGAYGGVSSPTRHDTPLVGLDLALRAEALVPLAPAFEHALIVLEGAVSAPGATLEPGRIAIWQSGRDALRLVPLEPSRAILLGGPPFPETISMWWNFVARTRDEIAAAARSWRERDGRFAPVASALAPLEPPGVPWRLEGRPHP